MSTYMSREDLFKYVERLEQRVSDLETMDRATRTSVGPGGIRITDEGKITFETSDGSVLAEFASDGLTFKDASGTTVAKFGQDGYVDTGGIVDPNVKVLTGSFADMAAITFDPPLSWGNYRLVAEGGVTVKNSNVDNRKESRLLIGSSASDVLVDNNGGVSIFDHPLAHSVGSTSGQSKVAVQSRQTDANIAPDKLWASVSFIAIRLS